jgi:hypothetical protein
VLFSKSRESIAPENTQKDIALHLLDTRSRLAKTPETPPR